MTLTLFDVGFKAMGSPCRFQFYARSPDQARNVNDLALACVQRLERKYSRYRLDSVVSRINALAGSGAVPIDQETRALLDYARQCYQESGGLFDITTGVLARAFDFRQGGVRNLADIDRFRARVGFDRISYDASCITVPAGMALDFGGIVKEYAVDTVAGLLQQHGIEHGLVELGGDIRVFGAQPDGRAWPIAVRNPNRPDTIYRRIQVSRGAVASSGDYERFIEHDGTRYSHVLNPKTGWPVSGVKAVTVVAEHCLVAGSLTTIAMLKDAAAPAWLKAQALPFLCCLADGRIVDHLNPVINL